MVGDYAPALLVLLTGRVCGFGGCCQSSLINALYFLDGAQCVRCMSVVGEISVLSGWRECQSNELLYSEWCWFWELFPLHYPGTGECFINLQAWFVDDAKAWGCQRMIIHCRISSCWPGLVVIAFIWLVQLSSWSVLTSMILIMGLWAMVIPLWGCFLCVELGITN